MVGVMMGTLSVVASITFQSCFVYS